MGQPIQVKTFALGDVAVLDTDRSLTGQEGAAFASAAAAAEGHGPAAVVAARLFAADAAIDHVFVASNEVVARRPGGWPEAALAAAVSAVGGVFVHYRSGTGESAPAG